MVFPVGWVAPCFDESSEVWFAIGFVLVEVGSLIKGRDIKSGKQLLLIGAGIFIERIKVSQ